MIELQMRINSEAKVIEETESKTLAAARQLAAPPFPPNLVTGKSSRKRWPSRTRISSARSAFPATLLDATGYSGIGRRLQFGG